MPLPRGRQFSAAAAIDEMPHRYHGMVEKHFGARVAHYRGDPLPEAGLVAVDRTLTARRLGFPVRTVPEPCPGVVEQFFTLGTEHFAGRVLLTTVKTNHRFDRPALAFDARPRPARRVHV